MDLQRLLTLRIRKRWRHRACNDLFVILENMPGRHQIDDISTSGLSYHYIKNGQRPKDGIYMLKVLVKNKSLSVSLVGRTMNDRETGALVSQNQVIMRRSIRFERMKNSQKKILKKIIKEYTVSRPLFLPWTAG